MMSTSIPKLLYMSDGSGCMSNVRCDWMGLSGRVEFPVDLGQETSFYSALCIHFLRWRTVGGAEEFGRTVGHSKSNYLKP